MFGMINMSGRKLTLLSIGCFLIFLAVCLLMLRAAAPDTVEIGGDAYPLSIEGDGDIEAFIEKCGYEPAEIVSDTEVTVPKIWNAVFEEYDRLQLAQGFDLVPYKGKTARRLVYSLADGRGFAEILISGWRIIAADNCSMKPGDKAGRLIPE